MDCAEQLAENAINRYYFCAFERPQMLFVLRRELEAERDPQTRKALQEEITAVSGLSDADFTKLCEKIRG